MSQTKNMTNAEKLELLKELYEDIAGYGRDGDTTLAHITPDEAMLLRAYGGSGTINPETGLPEYKKAVKAVTSVFSGVSDFLSKIPGFDLLSQYLGPIGYVMQAYSFLQERKLGKKMEKAEDRRVAEEKKLEEQKQKVAEAEQTKRSRLLARERYLKSEDITTQMARAGVAFGGTSSYSGAQGALGTQFAGEQSYLAGITEAGRTMSQTTTNIGQATSDIYSAQYGKAGWSNIATLGGNLGREFGIGNPYKIDQSSKSSDFMSPFDINTSTTA